MASPEHILVCLLRGESLPAGPVAWDGVLHLARTHGLSGVLAAQVPHHPDAARIALTFLSACEQDRQNGCVRNAVLVEEAANIAAAFGAAGVVHRFFKGIALLGTAYADVGQRLLSDIDVLVRPEQVENALEALQQLGYAADSAAPEQRAHQYGEVRLVSQMPWPDLLRPVVDLHTLSDYTRAHPAADLLAPLDELLWQGDPPAGAPLPMPPREVHLSALILHAAKHLPEQFAAKWYWDLHCLIGDGVLHWEAVVSGLARYRATGLGWLILRAVQQDLHTPVPDAALAALRPAGWVRGAAPLFRLTRLLRSDRLISYAAVGLGLRALLDDVPSAALSSLASAWWPAEATLRARFPERSAESLARLRLRRLGRGVRRSARNFRDPP